MKSIEERLLARATAIRALVPNKDKTHTRVSVPLQHAFAALRGAATLLPRTRRTANVAVDGFERDVRAGKIRPKFAESATALLAMRFSKVERAAALLASGKDGEVIKLLAVRSLKLTATVLAHISGAKLAVDLIELVGAAEDALKTGEALRLRAKQVESATDLLVWADTITLAASAWCYEAEFFIVTQTRPAKASEEEALHRMEKLILRMSHSWF